MSNITNSSSSSDSIEEQNIAETAGDLLLEGIKTTGKYITGTLDKVTPSNNSNNNSTIPDNTASGVDIIVDGKAKGLAKKNK